MPIPVISISQMRQWEQATWSAGQTEAEVIRQVGAFVAHRAKQLTRPGDSVLILAGHGNNGKDALAARDLITDRRVEVIEVGDPAQEQDRFLVALGRSFWDAR
jgi:NAD(P)H-hydrate epimerase